MGLVHNQWGGDLFVPDVFPRTLGSVPVGSSGVHKDNTWEYQSWVPDLVVINVGTNDWMSGTKGTRENLYIETMVEFVLNISSVYTLRPNEGEEDYTTPSFILACGPIASVYCMYMSEAIDVLSNISNVSVHLFQQEGRVGCSHHPSVAQHSELARSAVEFIQHTLNWSLTLSEGPTTQPSHVPSAQPSGSPSGQPTTHPSIEPSVQPTHEPTTQPSQEPSAQPSGSPSGQPTTYPSIEPSAQPSIEPTSDSSLSSQGQGQVQSHVVVVLNWIRKSLKYMVLLGVLVSVMVWFLRRRSTTALPRVPLATAISTTRFTIDYEEEEEDDYEL